MKKNLLWIFSITLLFFAVTTTTTSCDPEETCIDADCGNGSCFEDGCVCDVGYALDVNGSCTECASGYEKDANGDCVEIPECVDADCPANSSCVGNECVCDIGYENDADGNCVLERAKFFGLYDVVDICGTDTFRYEARIDELVGGTDFVRIGNLGNFDCVDPVTQEPVDYFVEAEIVGSSLSFVDYFTCATTFTGSGQMDSGVITMSYSATYDDGNGNLITDDCNTTFTKK